MKELTKKDKELVLSDISARLPYGIFVKDNHESLDGKPIIYTLDYHPWIDTCKPFLRPLSSMTEDERKELSDLINKEINSNDDDFPFSLYGTTGIKCNLGGDRFYFDEMITVYDWLNAHHFDYRGLIEKGLAIKVTEDNNPYNI